MLNQLKSTIISKTDEIFQNNHNSYNVNTKSKIKTHPSMISQNITVWYYIQYLLPLSSSKDDNHLVISRCIFKFIIDNQSLHKDHRSLIQGLTFLYLLTQLIYNKMINAN